MEGQPLLSLPRVDVWGRFLSASARWDFIRLETHPGDALAVLCDRTSMAPLTFQATHILSLTELFLIFMICPVREARLVPYLR